MCGFYIFSLQVFCQPSSEYDVHMSTTEKKYSFQKPSDQSLKVMNIVMFLRVQICSDVNIIGLNAPPGLSHLIDYPSVVIKRFAPVWTEMSVSWRRVVHVTCVFELHSLGACTGLIDH